MCVNCDKTKELLVFFRRTPPDIPSITIKGKAIERVTSTKLLGVNMSDDLAWGPHITMIHGKASQRLLFASFEAGRCGKHSYCKDIRLTCPLAVGICLPSVAHGSYCVRFWPTRRDTEEGNEDRIPRAAVRMRPHQCQHQHPTLWPTRRDTEEGNEDRIPRAAVRMRPHQCQHQHPTLRFFRGMLSPTHELTIYCLLHVWCLIISGRRHNSLHQEQEQRDTNVRLYHMAGPLAITA